MRYLILFLVTLPVYADDGLPNYHFQEENQQNRMWLLQNWSPEEMTAFLLRIPKKDPETTRKLLKDIGSDDYSTREAAASKLLDSYWDDPQYLEGILRNVDGMNAEARSQIRRILAFYKGKIYYWMVRRAMDKLGSKKDPKYIPALAHAIAQSKYARRWRGALVHCLDANTVHLIARRIKGNDGASKAFAYVLYDYYRRVK